MTTPTGQIGMSDVNAELGLAWNTNMDMNNWRVRLLADNGGGAIDMWSLRGKSRQKTWTRYNGESGSRWNTQQTYAYNDRSGWIVGHNGNVYWDGGIAVGLGSGQSSRDNVTSVTSGSDVYNRGANYQWQQVPYTQGSQTQYGYNKNYNLSRTFYI